MSDINKLKAEAYDLIRQMEAHTIQAQQIKQRVQEISQQIGELEDKESKKD